MIKPAAVAFVIALALARSAGAQAQAPTVQVQGGVIGGVVGGVSSTIGPASDGSPARDRQAVPAVGTSRISGRVIAADSGRPLRRALIRLSSMGSPGPGTRATYTDQDGRFEFTSLPAGRYSAVASRSGFVLMGYKQTRPGTPPQPIVLGERETNDRIDIALPPGAVITGRVVDEFGEPVPEVMVSAQRLQFTNGSRRPSSSGAPSAANDIGEFRLYGLAPGEYYVVASPRAQLSPMDVSTDKSGYAMTYYPSAPDLAAAQRLTVRAGDMLSNIVIALTTTQLARVSGMAVDAGGRPLKSGMVMALSRDGTGFGTSNGMVRPDGSFSISNLAPGEYVLRTTPTGPSGPDGFASMATTRVTVNGADLTGVTLRPTAPIVVHGRLVGDPATLATLPPSSTRFVLAPLENGPMMFQGPVPPPKPVADDLSFEMSAYPGRVALRPMGMLNAVVRAVRLNGRDATTGFDLEADGANVELDVEVTNATGRLTIIAGNTRDEPVTNRDVIVFSQDESEWGLPMPGHGSTGRTDEDGKYQTPPLLAGSYYVATTDVLELGQSSDPEFLASLRAGAQRVRLGAGDTATVRLRVSER